MNDFQGFVELDVTSLASGGRGVARLDGKVWMVDGAVPGDRVVAEPVRVRPSLVEGRTVRVLVPSPRRREPICPVQHACGGCPWMVLQEPGQRAWKRQVVVDSLERITRLQDPPVEPVIPSPQDLHYRGKVEFTLGRADNGTALIGLRHRQDPGLLVDVADCPVIPEAANRVLREVRRLLGAKGDGGDRGKVDPRGRRLVLRHSAQDGGILVIYRGQGREWAGSRREVQSILKLQDVVGVVALTGLPGRRGGVRGRLLAGRDYLVEQAAGTRFKVPAATFFQVNPAAAATLVEQVSFMAGDLDRGDTVLDLYGGVGVYAWALSRSGAEITVCEADPQAVAVGREGIGPSRSPVFCCDDVGRFLGRGGARRPARVVVANPPRTGFGHGVAAGIAAQGSEKVVLVSCDPATLARDLKPLLAAGYDLRKVVPVDLFPQTAHVETVSLLTRSG